MTVWDSVNQKVIYPVTSDPCGRIQKMLVYHPTTDTWEETPVPPNTHGATSRMTLSRMSCSSAGACSATGPARKPRIRRACTSGGTGLRPGGPVTRSIRPSALTV